MLKLNVIKNNKGFGAVELLLLIINNSITGNSGLVYI